MAQTMHAVIGAREYYHVLYTPLRKIRTGEITKEKARAVGGLDGGLWAASSAMATATSAAAKAKAILRRQQGRRRFCGGSKAR